MSAESKELRAAGSGRLRLVGAAVVFLGCAAAAAVLAPRLGAFAPRGNSSSARGGEALVEARALPEFELIDQDGQPFTKKSLASSVWIFDFVFTRCSGPCPVMTSKMNEVARELAGSPRVRLASISVDPEHDTPKVLTDFARMSGAKKDRWIFLTGEKSKVFGLSRVGFLLGVEENKPGVVDVAAMPLLHSTRFALVDGRARIRGYYDGTEAEAVARLIADARRIEAEEVP